MTGNNRSSFTVEVCSREHGQTLSEITDVEDFHCQVSLHPRFNHRKGIIYTHEFEVENMDDFTEYLRNKYNVISVQPATFIKTKEPNTKAFIVTFNQSQLPHSSYIAGERQDTRVIPTSEAGPYYAITANLMCI